MDWAQLAKAATELWTATQDISELEPLLHLARSRLVGIEGDLDYTPTLGGAFEKVAPKVLSARQAAKLIRPKQKILSTGFGGIARPSIFYIALASRAKGMKRPLGLTWITVTAAGARGQAPGSIEEMAIPGLVECYITAHIETVPKFFPLAKSGQMKIHTLPQGILTELVRALTVGETTVTSKTGLGTFLDSQSLNGKGSCAFGSEPSLATRQEDGMAYSIPPIDVAIITASFADKEGNLYADGSAAISEIVDAAYAARANHGKVIAVVQGVRENAGARKLLESDAVDHIVVHPQYEQLAGLSLDNAWEIFLPQKTEVSHEKKMQAYKALRLVNAVAGITSKRSAMSSVLARTAARLVQENIHDGEVLNLGVGLPEEVGSIFASEGLDEKVVFSVESGALGGIPSPGIFFGSALFPKTIETSYDTFARYRTNLAATVLGFLQIDAAGNVNVSKRGASDHGIIGPGGFIDICEGAKTIVFVGNFKARGTTHIEGGRVTITDGGEPKLVPVLDEVTFNAARALEKKKRVFYVTDFGVMALTADGLCLTHIFPGVDWQVIEMSLQIPVRVSAELETLDTSVVTGKGFRLDLRNRRD